MKHLPLPLPRLRSFSLLPCLLSAGAIASSTTSAATFLQVASASKPSQHFTNKTSTGYTDVAAGSPGTVDFIAHGLDLTYQNFGANERMVIGNVDDITTATIPIDRYISFTLGPDNIDALTGYTGGYTVELTWFFRSGINLDGAGLGNFEIRTSVDNFANPLASLNPTTAQLIDNLAPGLTVSGSRILTNDTVITTDQPLEIRLYTWYDQPGGSGLWANGISIWNFEYVVTTVPEPTSLSLLGALGILPLLRRRA